MKFISNYLRYTVLLFRDAAINMYVILELPANFVIVEVYVFRLQSSRSFENSVHPCQNTRCNIPEDNNLLMYFFFFVSVRDQLEAEGSHCLSYFVSTCVLVGCVRSNMKQAVRFRTCIFRQPV
jgi:hypothetical protein